MSSYHVALCLCRCRRGGHAFLWVRSPFGSPFAFSMLAIARGLWTNLSRMVPRTESCDHRGIPSPSTCERRKGRWKKELCYHVTLQSSQFEITILTHDPWRVVATDLDQCDSFQGGPSTGSARDRGLTWF